MEVLEDLIGERGTRYYRFEKIEVIEYTEERYNSDSSLVEGVQADEVLVEPIKLNSIGKMLNLTRIG
jgi:hypothetical protein